jgi:outer membrane protein insertion porin family
LTKFFRILYLLFIFIFLSFINLEANENFAISKIKFKNLTHLSKNTAFDIINLPENYSQSEYITELQIDEAIKKLFKQEYFNNISADYDSKNKTLTFIFDEKLLVSKVTVKGFLDNQEEQRSQLISIKKGSIYDKNLESQTKNNIEQAMSATKGTIDNSVEVTTKKTKNGSIEVSFIAREGENIIVDNLTFNGAENLSKEILEDAVVNRERDGFGWLMGRNDGEMKIYELENDKLKIIDKYREHGYLDVEVTKPTASIDFNRYKANITYSIKEGDQYSVNNIDIKQKNKLFTTKELLEILKLKEKNIFNILYLRKDLKKLKRKFADKGYAFVEVVPKTTQDKKNNTVDITYEIDPKELVTIRDVIISGNTRTMDRIVRREIFLAPQDLYSLTDLEDSKRALGRLGYFESVEIEEKKISPNEMDLIVKVKETMTGTIQVGGGYSSYQGLIFDASVSDRNVFGSGLDMGLGFQYSSISTNYNISITNPRLFDSLFSGTLSLFKNKFEYIGDFTIDQQGFTVGIGRRFGRNIYTNIGYTFNETQYSNVDSELLDSIESYDKKAIFASIKYDNTDDYFVPRKGFELSHRIEYAGLGGKAKFLENSSKLGIYQGLEDYIDYDLILRFKSQLRFLRDDGLIPINESFYMGGPGSVRGYQSFAFPDRDLGDDTKGTQNFINSVEASFPISRKAKLRFTIFMDYGFLGDKTLSDIAHRGGYGGAIEWISPMAPLQFIFARPINEHIGDETSFFEFTLGRRF